METTPINTKASSNPNLRDYKYQSVEINITAAAPVNGFSEYSLDFETDKQYEKCIGVAFEIIPSAAGVNTDNLKIGRFEIQNREIYSQGVPVKLFLNSNDVQPNEKFDRMIKEEAKGNKVNIVLREYNSGAFVPYTVVVTLQLSNITA